MLAGWLIHPRSTPPASIRMTVLAGRELAGGRGERRAAVRAELKGKCCMNDVKQSKTSSQISQNDRQRKKRKKKNSRQGRGTGQEPNITRRSARRFIDTADNSAD